MKAVGKGIGLFIGIFLINMVIQIILNIVFAYAFGEMIGEGSIIQGIVLGVSLVLGYPFAVKFHALKPLRIVCILILIVYCVTNEFAVWAYPFIILGAAISFTLATERMRKAK